MKRRERKRLRRSSGHGPGTWCCEDCFPGLCAACIDFLDGKRTEAVWLMSVETEDGDHAHPTPICEGCRIGFELTRPFGPLKIVWEKLPERVAS